MSLFDQNDPPGILLWRQEEQNLSLQGHFCVSSMKTAQSQLLSIFKFFKT